MEILSRYKYPCISRIAMGVRLAAVHGYLRKMVFYLSKMKDVDRDRLLAMVEPFSGRKKRDQNVQLRQFYFPYAPWSSKVDDSGSSGKRRFHSLRTASSCEVNSCPRSQLNSDVHEHLNFVMMPKRKSSQSEISESGENMSIV